MKRGGKGWRKGMTSAREDNTGPVAAMGHEMGPGAWALPMPGERNSTDTRSLENRRPTTTRLRDTISLMNRKRV